MCHVCIAVLLKSNAAATLGSPMYVSQRARTLYSHSLLHTTPHRRTAHHITVTTLHTPAPCTETRSYRLTDSQATAPWALSAPVPAFSRKHSSLRKKQSSPRTRDWLLVAAPPFQYADPARLHAHNKLRSVFRASPVLLCIASLFSLYPPLLKIRSAPSVTPSWS